MKFITNTIYLPSIQKECQFSKKEVDQPQEPQKGQEGQEGQQNDKVSDSQAPHAIGSPGRYSILKDAIDRMLARTLEMEDKKSLCEINNFCPTPGNFPRITMPNFVNAKDINSFIFWLEQKGYSVDPIDTVDPDSVLNTQKNVVTAKIAEWTGWDDNLSLEQNIANMQPPRTNGDPVIISTEEGGKPYILDGHHRWAYAKVYNMLKDVEGSPTFGPLLQVNASINDLVNLGKESPMSAIKSDKDDVLKRSEDPKIKYVVNAFRKEPMNGAFVDQNNNYIVNGRVLGKLVENASESPSGETGIFLTQELSKEASVADRIRISSDKFKKVNKMKLSKSASGKTTIKMSRSEWESYGRQAGWLKKSSVSKEEILKVAPKLEKYPQFLDVACECPDEEEVDAILRGDYGDTERQLCQIHMKCCNTCQR